MFDFDATGIEPSTGGGQKKLLPKQWFTFEIVPFTTKDGSKTYPLEGYTKKNNYPKVDVLVEVVDEGEFKGERVFHTVTFMPKGTEGAGMAIHWLKTIGEPHEGKIRPNPQNWAYKRFQGFPFTDEYNGKKNNKLGEIKPIEKSDDIPF